MDIDKKHIVAQNFTNFVCVERETDRQRVREREKNPRAAPQA